jgi:hypothetical protein
MKPGESEIYGIVKRKKKQGHQGNLVLYVRKKRYFKERMMPGGID